MGIEIDERKQKILRTVVQNYILTGKPVGSGAVAEACDLNVSTATIRNEMARLEKLGLLAQPHTSAGRIPTDIAYRYYVDILMGYPKPSPKDAEAVELLFAAQTREIEGLLHEASMLLSRLTRSAAMVFAPYTLTDTVRHLELIKLSDRLVMLVVITSKGQVGRCLVTLQQEVSPETVERVSGCLNREVAGKDLDEIDMDSLCEKGRFGRVGSELLRASLETAIDYLGSIEERVFIGGTANIIKEMDRAGSERVQTLLEALDRQYFILDLLKELIGEKRMTVRIGEENRLEELRKFAFIGTIYPAGSGLLGSLGVVGPTCMDYARTIGMVQYMADNLGRRLLSPSE